jgi:NADH:ubiquinone oxidoreductase subunit C
MLLTKNHAHVYKILLGFRTGLNSLFINIFKGGYLRIGIINGYKFQIELNAKYLYPFIFFCKNHSLALFQILIDLTCFEFIGTKYRYVLVYNLLSLNFTLRLMIKIKLKELNNNLLSITSIFYTAA